MPPHPITVGIETSGVRGSVAIVDDGCLVGQRTLGEPGRQHARSLISELDILLKEADYKPRDVQLIAVSIGPGSFTGLRVGVVAAKTWAYVTGCHLVGVGTFDAIAEAIPADSDVAWVIDDALRGEVYVQRFARRPHPHSYKRYEWVADTTVQVVDFDSWLSKTSPADLVSGPVSDKLRPRLAAAGLNVVAEDLSKPTASNVIMCGLGRSFTGSWSDPFQLVPMYIRRSAAEEKLDSQTAAGSKT